MNDQNTTLSDEHIAYLLQQEEYGGTEIQHIFLPPSATITSLQPSQSASKDRPTPKVIVLDDSYSEEDASLPKIAQSIPETNDDQIGVLDVHQLFVDYNNSYFEGKLGAVSVEWSPRMTLCAGLCTWNHFGDCRIKLSSKLLQYRSNKELKETLLHECIHAYLFVTHNNKDRDGHGPEFLKMMNRINQAGGFNITVYHSFVDEVNHFRTHWWQCDKCKNIIKRAMNRAPGLSDWWFPRHQRECGGNYTKIKSPPEKENTKKRKRDDSVGPSSEKDPGAKKPKFIAQASHSNGKNATTPSHPSSRPRSASVGAIDLTDDLQGSPAPKSTNGTIMAWISKTPQPKPTQPK